MGLLRIRSNEVCLRIPLAMPAARTLRSVVLQTAYGTSWIAIAKTAYVVLGLVT